MKSKQTLTITLIILLIIIIFLRYQWIHRPLPVMKGDDYSRIISINTHSFYERDNKELRDALIAIVDQYQVRATPYTWTGDSSHFIYEITYGLKHLILVDEGKHIMYRSDKNGFYEIIHGDDLLKEIEAFLEHNHIELEHDSISF